MTPAIFIGHGSPMNAIEENIFTQTWRQIANKISPKPTTIVVISAHWVTNGTKISGTAKPVTIHDFGGFPRELFDKQYPAQGDPILAKKIATRLDLEIDNNFGLDHGAWSVLAQMYPLADIPVLQISLDINKSLQQHFELGQKLAYLREQGVMILGTGNIVHNLRLIDWQNNNNSTWIKNFDRSIVKNIKDKDFQSIIDYQNLGEIANKSVPTPEHFWPLLYTLGSSNSKDNLEIYNQEIVMDSISMTSVVSASKKTT